MENKIPVSALVVCFNEGHLLKDCLESISFCAQVVVVDLGSSDNSVKIAEVCGAEVWHMDRLPVVEMVHSRVINRLNFDWALITDPDEVSPQNIYKDIIEVIKAKNIGIVYAPRFNYFKNKKLEGTYWGGRALRCYLINRKRVELTSQVHTGIILKNDYKKFILDFRDSKFIKHYWISSRKQFYEKHFRYLKKEGESRYKRGERTSLGRILKTIPRSFFYSFIELKGYREGILGFELSFYWACYSTISQLQLFRFQITKKIEHK